MDKKNMPKFPYWLLIVFFLFMPYPFYSIHTFNGLMGGHQMIILDIPNILILLFDGKATSISNYLYPIKFIPAYIILSITLSWAIWHYIDKKEIKNKKTIRKITIATIILQLFSTILYK